MGGWIRVGICFGTAVMLISLLLSGEISLFVNPRLKWLVALSILMLIILGLVQLWNLKAEEMHHIGFWGYALVLLPILMFFFLPPKALDANIAAKKGVSYLTPQAIASQQKLAGKNQANNNSTQDSKDQNEQDQETATNKEPEFANIENPYKKFVKQIKAEPVITLTEKNYADYLNTINMYPKEFSGKKIRLIGFVYRDETLKKNEFVIGRFTVTCCTADAGVVGLLTTYPGAQHLKLDQWIEATGTVQTIQPEGYDMPVIKLTSYKTISPPKDPYIYFNY
ncbi:TIGR03943 family putative permease subunit [Paenactinomyces guangxiensis]|uniref:TIGR03943 family protein n=1 Tax=Paenactinomyces guangxiensis TaxID=1490290 RepID=A0A7W2A7A2_9BACL|nr:TIGR03943 family protein [Paenactinomyces guangxiensis]MBA4493340.1 TIGR03943 family protein [Paenactinomyces guangxiensis]MBH8593434.1 TIGR03943 family protein [Paenactinomyces guangxiensis]